MSISLSLWKRIKSLEFKVLLVISLLVVFTTTGCSLLNKEYEYTSEEFLMDTFIKIKVYAENEQKAKEAAQKAFEEMKRIELLTNRFPKEDTPEYQKSDIIKINREAIKKPVQVSPDVFEMLTLSKEYALENEQAFEITIGPVMDLWGFGQDKQQVPEQQALKEKLSLVDSKLIKLDKDKQTVALEKENMSIDLGGIAKGYATEQAAQVLRTAGIKKAIINAGGNIYALGEKEQGVPWKIGIQDPRQEDQILAVLNLKDQVAVTSGDYQRFFTANGERYHHILDPKTGTPARGIISVTIICQNSTIADILSTTFFVQGVDKSLDYIKKHPGIEAVFVTDTQEIIYSPGLKSIIELKDNEEL